MKKLFIFLLLVACYGAVVSPLSAKIKNRSFEEKLGYLPSAQIMRFIAADQKEIVAQSVVLKALMYFGGLADTERNKLRQRPDFPLMKRNIETALKLDPFNMDGYYFAQAVLVWDLKQVKEANELLDFGMKYRTWDFYLPLFAGFNAAFFLKDYEAASRYYKLAGELSGSDLFSRLAGRFMYEANQTTHAIAFLTSMVNSTKNEMIKKSFQTRLDAFKEVKRVEDAASRYAADHPGKSASMDLLVKQGYLDKAPVDPYGGEFYIDDAGRVRTTSKFAFKSSQK